MVLQAPELPQLLFDVHIREVLMGLAGRVQWHLHF